MASPACIPISNTLFVTVLTYFMCLLIYWAPSSTAEELYWLPGCIETNRCPVRSRCFGLFVSKYSWVTAPGLLDMLWSSSSYCQWSAQLNHAFLTYKITGKNTTYHSESTNIWNSMDGCSHCRKWSEGRAIRQCLRMNVSWGMHVPPHTHSQNKYKCNKTKERKGKAIGRGVKGKVALPSCVLSSLRPLQMFLPVCHFSRL